jgi:DNA-binding NarL/FixJ family response regulator
MIDVLVADDQELIRDGLRAVLEADTGIRVVGEAADGRSAVELARTLHPTVVLMDVRMPGLDGIAATAEIVADPPAPYVLVLTTFDLDEYIVAALRAGASGFLLKDAPRERIVEAVIRVASGEAQLAPQVARRLMEKVLNASPTHPSPPVRLPDLSPREADVLRLVARGLSNAEIADRLYLAHTTVKSYVASVLAKLGVRDRVQATVAAYESGLVQPGADHSH